MSRSVRVLSVQHYPVFGGPYNEIIELEPYLNTHGVQTIVAMTDEPGTAAGRIQDHVICERLPLHRLHRTADPRRHMRSLGALAADVRRLRSLIRRYRVDLVKVHGAHNPHGAIAARLEGVPIVWVISSTFVPMPLRRVGMLYVRPMCAVTLVNGRGLIDAYPGMRALGSRVHVYHSPVNPDRFAPASPAQRASMRAQLGIPSSAPVVSTIANVNPQKGIDLFVEAAGRLARSRPETRFLVVGAIHENQRDYYQRVLRAAASAGLGPPRLTFCGAQEDVPSFLAAMDVKVISSRAEGTSTTAGEAMGCGIPVIATNVGAVREIVADGETGFIVPPNDAEVIADRVRILLDDDDMRRRMGLAGRQRLLDRFTAARCAEIHTKTYDHALRIGGAPRAAAANTARRQALSE